MSIGSSELPEISHVPHQSNPSESANGGKTQDKGKELVPGAFLGIDFGESKIGLSVADSETRMAFAYETLPNDNSFFTKLREIIEKENIKAIIIGIPAYKHGSDDVQKFGEGIGEKFAIRVEYQNEMFTTKMAQENIKKRGKKNIAKMDDKEAARIILQDWLDRQTF